MGTARRFKTNRRERNGIGKQESLRKKTRKDFQKKKLINTASESNVNKVVEEHFSSSSCIHSS